MPAWAGPVSTRVSVLAATAEPGLLLGEFRCPPSDPAWRGVNDIGVVPHVVFPGTAVAIEPLRGDPLVADANRILLYGPGQGYRRSLLDPRGDHCLFLAVDDASFPDRVRSAASFASSGSAVSALPNPLEAYRALHVLRAAVRGGADQLEVDEHLIGLLDAVLATAPTQTGRGSVATAMAEAVRTVLALRFAESLTLEDLGREIGVSPYHLHRRFRQATGWTIHAYREQLRLREAFARVVDGEPDLALLAHELGFSSHSHFTARYRRAFGITPSRTRSAVARGQLARV